MERGGVNKHVLCVRRIWLEKVNERRKGNARVRMRKHRFGGGAEITCVPDNSVALRLTSVPLNATHVGNLVLLPQKKPMWMAERLLQRYQEPVLPPQRCGRRGSSVDCQKRTPRSSYNIIEFSYQRRAESRQTIGVLSPLWYWHRPFATRMKSVC